MKKVDLYTDGACSYNPGPGGYGIVLKYKDVQKEVSGFCDNTTNNRMEITAVIEGFKLLKEPCDVTVYSDSAYTLNAFLEGWLENWQKNNWRTAGKKQVLNVDLWQELLKVIEPHKVTWVKVKGHADNELNNRCDALARKQIEENTKK
ncbi:MAG: ribonuclease HI [Clostridia bacterium]|nr:ribonuclease HI [Clostridia bacterium]